MIPGEYFLDDDPIELNRRAGDAAARGGQPRRSAGAGGLALPFLRGEPLSRVRSRRGLWHAPERARPAPRSGSSRATPARWSSWRSAASRGRVRPQSPGRGAARRCGRCAPRRSSAPKSSERPTPHENRSTNLLGSLRTDHRRSHPSGRHGPRHPHRGRCDRVWRRGEVRRRQGDSRRHGAVALGDAPGRHARSRHHERRHRRQHRHPEGRCRHSRRPHRRDRQGRAIPASWTASRRRW